MMSPSNDDTKGPKIQCGKCGSLIQSMHVHDFVTCSCGGISVDGGAEYIRLSFRERTDVLTENGELFFKDESAPMDDDMRRHLMGDEEPTDEGRLP